MREQRSHYVHFVVYSSKKFEIWKKTKYRVEHYKFQAIEDSKLYHYHLGTFQKKN